MDDCPCAKRRPKIISSDETSIQGKESSSVTFPSQVQPQSSNQSDSTTTNAETPPLQKPTSGRNFWLPVVPAENKRPRSAAVGYRHLFEKLRTSSKMEPHGSFKKVTHCIFDMDGLMLDTEVIYEQIVRQITQEFQQPYPLEVRTKVLGTTERRTAEIIVAELKLPIAVDAFLIKFRKLCYEMLGDAKLMKGVERLVRHLHKNHIPIAVATSSSAPMVEVKIEKHSEIFNLMHHMVCGSTDEEVKQGKPAPDIFFVAARRFGDNVQPGCCLVFEDAPNGVTAANSAGMQVVMVPDPHTPSELCKDATQVLRTMEDFRPEQYGLPSY